MENVTFCAVCECETVSIAMLIQLSWVEQNFVESKIQTFTFTK